MRRVLGDMRRVLALLLLLPTLAAADPRPTAGPASAPAARPELDGPASAAAGPSDAPARAEGPRGFADAARRAEDDCGQARAASKPCVLALDAEDVTGATPAGEGASARGLVFGRQRSLIRLRNDFLPEIVKATDDL